MILDVGCGSRPSGHVNVDRFPESTIHRHESLGNIDTKKIQNFVRADIHFLPFPDKTFEQARCIALLEHSTVRFTEAVRELVRVAKIVFFSVPHRMARNGLFGSPKNIPGHDKFFNVKTLDKWLQKNYPVYQIKTIYKSFPNDIISLINIPWDLEVTLESE